MSRRDKTWLVRGGLMASWVISLCGVSVEAHASKAYGYTLITAGYLDGCAACHDDNATQGGLGTANKPFAATMKRLGLTGNGDNDFFREILNEKLLDYDTDCDGVIDLDELTNNGDVNDPAVVPEGFTAMFVAGCNDDVVTEAPSSTDTSSDDSTAPTNDGDEGGSEGTGCTMAKGVGEDSRFGLALVLTLLGFAFTRRARANAGG